MVLLARTVGLTRDTWVLDVGGTVDIWRLAPVMPRLVLLNQAPLLRLSPLRQDASHVPFPMQNRDDVQDGRLWPIDYGVIGISRQRPETKQTACEVLPGMAA
jgi:hypothetical protein